jgi:hypothetical protein
MSHSIARMEAALQRLGAEHEPPWGWETRVLAATRQRSRRCNWWLAIPAAALIALASISWPSPKPPDDNLALHVLWEPVGPIVRGNSAHVGDRAHITATSADRYRAIWVYRNEHELVVACPAGLSCRRSGNTTTVDVTLLAVGSYTFVAVTSASPLPEPRGTYDSDRAAAEKARAAIVIQPLEVR